ncbi:hypothetical protein KI688_012691 [Linnemannia hyalina]|uniref:Uncharacterized protein n=1 Tax=Linnemannia hyalina TaxID=64524 RepID=A0A9P7XSY9_9FUNG|nr:hypothetical protein KI688_012691 [Linnemannia hyalina]
MPFATTSSCPSQIFTTEGCDEIELPKHTPALYNPSLVPFDDLPEPPAGLQPLKLKKVTLPFVLAVDLVILLPLLEHCTGLQLDNVQVATYWSRFILLVFKKIKKRNQFKHFTIGITSMFSYEMMTLLRLNCFVALESLTTRGGGGAC